MNEPSSPPPDPGQEALVVDPADGHNDPGVQPEASPTPFDPIAEAVRPWRAAEALKALRRQVDAAYPTRKKGSDGIVGDAAHQSRASDHNPWISDGHHGVVSAMDITHDPASGCDAGKIVAALRASKDPRIKYLIWNRRIANESAIGSAPAWTWRSYSGRNPHDHHFHLSLKSDKTHYDSTAPWILTDVAEAADARDRDGEALMALATLGASVDLDAPAWPQLIQAQQAVTQLIDNYCRAESELPATVRPGERTDLSGRTS
jgi:hypothetical protein